MNPIAFFRAGLQLAVPTVPGLVSQLCRLTLLLGLLLAAALPTAQAQKAAPKPYLLAKVAAGGKWGFINDEGKEVIPLKYEMARGFSDGLALVKLNDKWSYINKDGQIVLSTEYTQAGSFSKGLAAVEQAGKWGFIDKTGKVVVPIEYEHAYITGFENGLTPVVRDGKTGFINTKGGIVVPFQYDRLAGGGADGWFVEKDGKLIRLDKNGRELPPDKYEVREGYNEGLCPVKLKGKWGFIDQAGQEVIRPEYYNVRGFKGKSSLYAFDPSGHYDTKGFANGLCAVKAKDEGYNFKWGIINKQGQVVVPFKYQDVGAYQDGMRAVELNDKWGFINGDGREVVPCQYQEVHLFAEGLAAVKRNGLWGFVDKTGKEVVECKYLNFTNSRNYFSGGICPASLPNAAGWGFIDKAEKVVIPFAYSNCYSLSENVKVVVKNNRMGLFNKSGAEITPPVYSYLGALLNVNISNVQEPKL